MTSDRTAGRQPAGQALDELAALRAVVRAVSMPGTTDGVAAAAVSAIIDVVRPDRALLFMRAGERLDLIAVEPSMAVRRPGDIPAHQVGECLCGLAVRQQTSLFSGDIPGDPRACAVCTGAGSISFAAIPVTHRDEMIGAVGLASNTGRDFEPLAGFLEMLAGVVASALVNARLAATAQRVLTERRLAERALAESETRLSMLFNSNQALQMLVAVEPAGVFRVEAVNQVFLETARGMGFEVSARDVVGRTIAELSDVVFGLPASVRDPALEHYRQAASSGLPLDYEEAIETPGGHFWSEVTILPIVDPAGACTHLLWTSRDITDRVRAQAALRESEERSRILAEASFEGIAITAQGVLVDCSQQMAQMLGSTRSDLLGRSVREFIAPEDRDLAAEAQRSGRLEPYEHLMLRVDGSVFPAEVRARTAEVGGREMRITAIRDITERKRAEQALQVFQYSIDQASDAVFWMNRDGGFAYVNDQACRSLGYAREELLHLRLWDIDPVLPRDRWFEQWAAYQADRRGGAEQLESLHRRKDGSTFPVEVVAKHLWLGDEELHVAFVRDISGRRQAEEALGRSEADLQLALEAARMGDWSWDIVTGDVVWSARCKALYGLAPDTEMTYERFLGCLHPDDRGRVDAALRQAVEDRTDYQVEKRAIWPDGSLHWTATGGRVICDAAGEPVRMTGVSLDITERKLAEAAVRESEERLRLAITAANQGLYDLNVQTGEAVVSAEYATMLGYDPADFHETNAAWIARLHPDDREVVAAAYGDYVAGRRPDYRVEFRQRTKSGDWKWILSLGKIAEHDAAGQPLRMLGTHTDITERKHVEEALRESEERFAVFMDNLPAGSFMKDIPGGVVYANRYLRDMFGWGDVAGRSTRDLLPAEVAEKMEAEDRAALAHGPLTITEHVRDAADRERVFQTSKFPIPRAGRPPLLGGITVDVTARTQAEDALRASLAEKVVLLKEVHHRVKNNLQIISSLLNLQASAAQNPEVQAMLRDTQGRIRAMALLHETLYGSDSLAGVNVRNYVRTVGSQVVRAFASNGRDIQLVQDVADVLLPLDQAIPVGLILNELLSNALKHAFPDRTRGEITVQLDVDDGHYALCVADNGVGLSSGAGSGANGSVGLLLVEGLVRQLDGELSVTPDAGTRFRIVFPIQRA